MEKIGITGGLGTGKSKVLEIVRKLGSPAISADEIVHQEMGKGQKVYEEIVHSFGENILGENGEIDRSRLAEIVFTDEKKRQQLEALVHPRVREVILEFFDQQARKEPSPAAVFVEVPLLYEVGWEKHFDRVWVVYAPREMVRNRLLKANRYSPEDLNARLQAQMSLREKVKRADVVIENKGSLRDLEKRVRERWRRIHAKNSSDRPR